MHPFHSYLHLSHALPTFLTVHRNLVENKTVCIDWACAVCPKVPPYLTVIKISNPLPQIRKTNTNQWWSCKWYWSEDIRTHGDVFFPFISLDMQKSWINWSDITKSKFIIVKMLTSSMAKTNRTPLGEDCFSLCFIHSFFNKRKIIYCLGVCSAKQASRSFWEKIRSFLREYFSHKLEVWVVFLLFLGLGLLYSIKQLIYH